MCKHACFSWLFQDFINFIYSNSCCTSSQALWDCTASGAVFNSFSPTCANTGCWWLDVMTHMHMNMLKHKSDTSLEDPRARTQAKILNGRCLHRFKNSTSGGQWRWRISFFNSLIAAPQTASRYKLHLYSHSQKIIAPADENWYF